MTYVIRVIGLEKAYLAIRCKNSTIIAPQADEWGLIPLWNPVDFPIADFTSRYNNDSITSSANYRAQGPKALGNWELVNGWPAV